VRTITTQQQKVRDAGNQADHVRLSVKDLGGTFRDLTSYPGFNALKSVTWGERIDDPHATFDAELFREQFNLNLSPFRASSPLNHAFDPANSFAQLIALNREVKIEVAITPHGRKTPNAGDWMEVFRGRIDTLDPAAAGRTIRIGGRALSGRLAQQYIKQERVYSFAAVAGVAVPLVIWQPQMAVTTSPLIYVLPASRGNGSTPDPGFNKFLKCTQAGTTGTTEPVWTTGTGQVDGTAKWDYVGAPTTSGNPVEQIIQNILDDNKGTGDPTVTLYTPSSPGWAITQFLQQRGFTLDAVRALALQIGWDLRYKWRSGPNDFEFTLYQPTRSSPTVAFTFNTDEYQDPTQLAVEIATIRNSWRGIYSDASDLWPDGTPKRKVIEVSDSTSITKYGELWAEIQEDSASQIDSSAEMTALLNAALSDCKEPTAVLGVPLVRGFPWVEINDYYTFNGNNQAWDGGSLAVTEYHHSFDNNAAKLVTQLVCRGLPTIGTASWLGNSFHPRLPVKQDAHRMVHFDGTETASLSTGNLVGGAQHQIAKKTDKVQLPKEYEIHVYPVPGTALSSSTLATVTSDLANFSVKGLIPGKVYCQRIVERYRNQGRLLRMQPGVETTFTAYQANAGHLSSIPDLSRLPLNGGFETSTDASGPPDHWTVSAGTWATNITLATGAGGISGESYVTFTDVALSRSLDSDVFVVEQGSLYEMSFWIQEHNASINGQLVLTWLASDQSTISTVTLTSDSNAVAAWQQYFSATFAPSNARFAKVSLQTVSGANAHGFDVDLVKLRKLVQVGALMFGANAFPNAAGTTFMNPGGPVAANQAAALNIELPTRTGSRFWLHGFFIRSATAPVNMSYAITDPNGPLTLTWTAGITSETTTIRQVRPLPLNTGNRLDIQVVATVTGAGPTGGTNIIATYGVWN
jgi:hypothetical protein